jgi:uncharacterized protein (TIGR02246 family)
MSLRRTLPLLLALVVAAAWSQVGRGDQPTDEPAIILATEQYTFAWNHHDPKAMAALFTQDGDVVTPYGQFLKGRQAVEERFNKEQAGWAKDVKLTTAVDGIRLVKPDVVLVDGTVSAAGAREADGQVATLRGRFSNVMVKRDGQWLILARRVMLNAPEPVAPPAKN